MNQLDRPSAVNLTSKPFIAFHIGFEVIQSYEIVRRLQRI